MSKLKGFGLGFNGDNVKVIDFNSVLDFLAKELGPSHIDYYKRFLENKNELLKELGARFQKVSASQEVDKNRYIEELMKENKVKIEIRQIRLLLIICLAINEFIEANQKHYK
jgi:hypothetical protein